MLPIASARFGIFRLCILYYNFLSHFLYNPDLKGKELAIGWPSERICLNFLYNMAISSEYSDVGSFFLFGRLG